jgi:methylated-DNA-[protein]-cysteine S-methyltransferase
MTAAEPLRQETVCAGRLSLTLGWQEDRLRALALGWSQGRQPTPAPGPSARALADALARYVQGRAVAWPALPLAWDALTPFGRTVLRTLRDQVGFGRTVSYGELAALAGRPGAARAVGRAMATNPWPLVVPCHRVLGASGRLHGFGGCGLPMKAYLLELEGVTVSP